MNNYKPYLVSWNLTKRCNLLCPHCYIDSDSAIKGTLNNSELTTDEAKSVIDELYSLNNNMMLILSGGEPMLRDDVFEIIEYASDAGFITVLGTNGTLLTREKIDLLRDAGLKGMGVSIDSPDSHNHDRFRGLDGAWDMSISALGTAHDSGIETQMDVTLTDENIGEIDNFIELGSSLSVKAVNFFFLVCTGRAVRTDISSVSYESALRRIAELSSKEKRLMVRARCAPHIHRLLYEDGVPVAEGTRGCLAGRQYIRIDPEGNITPCPYMSLSLGNIRESSLSDIWENASSLKLLQEGKYSGRCGSCEYEQICGGCRARALTEKNDFMEEDPLCTYEPRGGSLSFNDNFKSDLVWDETARKRVKKIPVFMKNMIIKVIEDKAREKGISIITSDLIDELKTKRYPAFHKQKG